MTVLAKAIKGKEFLYNGESAHRVSKAKAEIIRDILNKNNYMLKEGEIWHVYDVDRYDTAYIYAEGQAFKTYKGQIRRYY